MILESLDKAVKPDQFGFEVISVGGPLQTLHYWKETEPTDRQKTSPEKLATLPTASTSIVQTRASESALRIRMQIQEPLAILQFGGRLRTAV